MRDSEDLHQYMFVGKLAEKREGTFLRIELLLMTSRGEADLETLVQRSDSNTPARISEIPSIIGEEAVETFARMKNSIASTSERYLARQISAAQYLAVRDAALASYGTSTRGLCEARLREILPHDPTGSLPLPRRVQIVAEVIRDEITLGERRMRQKAETTRARVEHSYRRAATRGKDSAVTPLPMRAYVAAMFCGLGFMIDVGSAVGPTSGGYPTPNQVGLAIVMGIISILARGPLLAAVITRNPDWKSRAAFTIIALAVLVIVSGVLLALNATGPHAGLVVGGVAIGTVLRLGWLAFWGFYLGVFSIERESP